MSFLPASDFSANRQGGSDCPRLSLQHDDEFCPKGPRLPLLHADPQPKGRRDSNVDEHNLRGSDCAPRPEGTKACDVGWLERRRGGRCTCTGFYLARGPRKDRVLGHTGVVIRAKSRVDREDRDASLGGPGSSGQIGRRLLAQRCLHVVVRDRVDEEVELEAMEV